MTIRSIFLVAPAETSHEEKGPTSCAIELAKRHNAQLTVFCVSFDVTTPGRRTDALALAAKIEARAKEAGVSAKIITDHSHAIGVNQVVAELARLHDVSVIGSAQDGLLSERTLAEQLLFESGRPCLLVPADWSGPIEWTHSVVAWDNSAVAARALGDSVALFGFGTTDFLGISGDKPFGLGIEPAAVVEATARRGIMAKLVEADLGGRSISNALQDEAKDSGASLLVMGAFGHTRLRRFVLGSATGGILDDLRMPVLMSH